MYQKILCPVDGSDASDRGMNEAIRLAGQQRSTLCFLHVVDNGALMMCMPVAEGAFDVLREGGQKTLTEAVEAARAQGVDAQSQLKEIIDGRVSAAIIGEAQDSGADLIVMGTHGRRGVSRLLLGSDAATVVGTSPVPVLLVK